MASWAFGPVDIQGSVAGPGGPDRCRPHPPQPAPVKPQTGPTPSARELVYNQQLSNFQPAVCKHEQGNVPGFGMEFDPYVRLFSEYSKGRLNASLWLWGAGRGFVVLGNVVHKIPGISGTSGAQNLYGMNVNVVTSRLPSTSNAGDQQRTRCGSTT